MAGLVIFMGMGAGFVAGAIVGGLISVPLGITHHSEDAYREWIWIINFRKKNV